MFARTVLQVHACQAQCEKQARELEHGVQTASGIHRLQKKLRANRKPARPKPKQATSMTVQQLQDRGWTPDDVARSGAKWAELQAHHGTQALVHDLGMTLEHAVAAGVQPDQLCRLPVDVLQHWGADGAALVAAGATLEHLALLRCTPAQLSRLLRLSVGDLRQMGVQCADGMRRLCPAATLREWVEAMGDPVADVVRTQHDAETAGYGRADFDAAQNLLAAMNAPTAPDQAPTRLRDPASGTRVGELVF